MKEAFPKPVHPRWRRGKSGGTTPPPSGLDNGPLRAPSFASVIAVIGAAVK
jgi:hypothetical protein